MTILHSVLMCKLGSGGSLEQSWFGTTESLSTARLSIGRVDSGAIWLGSRHKPSSHMRLRSALEESQ